MERLAVLLKTYFFENDITLYPPFVKGGSGDLKQTTKTDGFIWRYSMHLKGTVKIVKEENCFVAICLENDVASQGETVEEAIENLKERAR